MEKIEGKSFDREEVEAGGKHFVNCTFVGCMICYAGDGATFENCTVRDCAWLFDGAAQRTMSFTG